jgi:hypothetical protein
MLERLKGRAFQDWDHTRHNQVVRASNNKYKNKNKNKNKNDCCFNHIIGLPTKDGSEKPMFDYEREIFSALTKPSYLNSYPQSNRSDIKRDNVLFPFKAKHLWIKKATGLGVTEFMLRFMVWPLC